MKKDLWHLAQYELRKEPDLAPDGSFRSLFVKLPGPIDNRSLICITEKIFRWDCIHVTLMQEELDCYPLHEELLFVKDLFFDKDEKVIQICEERYRKAIRLWHCPLDSIDYWGKIYL